MLHTTTKQDIRLCYKNLQDLLEGFVPRKVQNYLVAEIAKTLGGEYNKKRRIMVAEAGTGTGKSMAYLMASVPYALNNNKKVVISTATVALQEQLLNKDLPLFRRICPKPFDFILAKGRQRYCCAERLAVAAESQPASQDDLFSTTKEKSPQKWFISLYTAYSDQKWDGDRDSWPETIPDEIWAQIVSDKHSCQPGMPAHRQCPFTKSRQGLAKADVIIANHALLMADLELGGGVILPEPEQSIYMIDEAHHLPIVARDFSAAFSSLTGAANWLEKLNKSSSKFLSLTDANRSDKFYETLQSAIQTLIPELRHLSKQLQAMPFSDDGIYRFEDGELPSFLEEPSQTCKLASQKALSSLGKLHDLISEKVKNGELSSKTADPALAESGFFLSRLENLNKVWQLMAKPLADKGAPLARWLELHDDKDISVHASPLEVGWQLDNMIWSRAAGAALVSATIRALNKFSYFCHQSGLREDDGTQFLALPSPFDYYEQAELVVPETGVEPQDNTFTDKLPKILREYLKDQPASLVLFSSYWQMNQVAQKLKPWCKKHDVSLLVQGTESRQQLLEKHRKTRQKGKASVLFGTGSFSEGLDLPGDLLTNLIITKIPFAVPTSPVEEAHAEYIEKRGGNPFLQISVPEASRKLIQSVGRLLRKETDCGRVVLLDRRIVTRRYGKALLDSLPPFRRRIEY